MHEGGLPRLSVIVVCKPVSEGNLLHVVIVLFRLLDRRQKVYRLRTDYEPVFSKIILLISL
jgi:hypothetical protein